MKQGLAMVLACTAVLACTPEKAEAGMKICWKYHNNGEVGCGEEFPENYTRESLERYVIDLNRRHQGMTHWLEDAEGNQLESRE